MGNEQVLGPKATFFSRITVGWPIFGDDSLIPNNLVRDQRGVRGFAEIKRTWHASMRAWYTHACSFVLSKPVLLKMRASPLLRTLASLRILTTPFQTRMVNSRYW